MVNHRCKSITVGGHFVYGRIIYWYFLFRYDECVLFFCEKTKQLFYGKSLAGIFHSRNWQYDWCVFVKECVWSAMLAITGVMFLWSMSEIKEKNSYQLYETLHINDVEFLCSPREENQNSEV